MNGTSTDSYRDLASTLSPPAVQQYLAANEWELETSQPDVKEIWRLPGERGPRGRILLPLATDYVDFDRRFHDTLHALATIYDWDLGELAEHITSTRADLFYVRLDQEMLDGTIPFRQAEHTLEALFRMLKAAATTADDPTHSHRGRRSSTVTDFLEDDVRLGHTKRGSFVFTVVTRLGDPVPKHGDDTPVSPFPRRVMETLATGLNTSRDLALSGDASVIDEASQHGLSANLVESLLELTQVETLRELDLSFDWAAAEPPPRVPTSRIVVDRQAMAGLPRVRERLVRRESPPRMETLVGRVRSLTREEQGVDQEEATIVLAAEVDGRVRKVHIPLPEEDYTWAIFAHTNKLPLIVTGSLVFERGAWRLSDPITVDVAYLRNHRTEGDDPARQG
ncbi:hypothetical protein [Saccharothrix lopnurensis]|uniref:Uncharacterized protein n=1 Tax=Saccharothrix lopnurensis TaxID=1670621 RepID=A0ABW1P533_9PSEU